MVSFTMPYMIPLFLGMTFDARHSRPGVSIFDDIYVDNPTIVNSSSSDSDYYIVTGRSELLKNLDIEGDLSLRIKAGMINLHGKGSYLENEHNFDNSIIILTNLKYTSQARILDLDVKPRSDWITSFNPQVLGTHYVSQITYGVEMVASAKFVVHNVSDLESVKSDAYAYLDTHGKGSNINADGKLDKLVERIRSKSSLEISYFGTLPLKKIPNSIDGFKTLISTFEEQVKEAGLENGIPISVVLTPLVNLASEEEKKKFNFLKNEELMASLDDIETKFDELNSARAALKDWAKTLPFDLDVEYRNMTGSLLREIDDVLNVFYKVLWDLDVTKNEDQLDEAINAYGTEYRKYRRLVTRLKRKIDPLVDKDAYVTGASFIHWGNNTCPGERPTLLYKGFTIGSTEEGVGGVSHYACVDENLTVKYDLSTAAGSQSSLAGIRYGSMEGITNPFQGPYVNSLSGEGVPCAKCYYSDAETITMVPAAQECPVTWYLKYKGYLMSAKQGAHTTEYICVDEIPSQPYSMDSVKNTGNVLVLTTIHSSGALPSSRYTNGALVKCVVCAMKSENVL